MGWQFAAILGGALVVSVLLGLWQQGRYATSVNAMVKNHHGTGRILVTGRGLGRLRGTIVMLIIDDAADQVVAASKLRGTTIFATAKDAPDLIGPVADLADRATDKQTRKAVDMALTQLSTTRNRLSESRIVIPQKTAGTAKRKVSQ
jgi:DNA-binding transcriptional regulator of glucitol operon